MPLNAVACMELIAYTLIAQMKLNIIKTIQKAKVNTLRLKIFRILRFISATSFFKEDEEYVPSKMSEVFSSSLEVVGVAACSMLYKAPLIVLAFEKIEKAQKISI